MPNFNNICILIETNMEDDSQINEKFEDTYKMMICNKFATWIKYMIQ